jgi:hypothetical protein
MVVEINSNAQIRQRMAVRCSVVVVVGAVDMVAQS